MAKTPRPSLSAVMDKGTEARADSSPAAPAVATATPRKSGKRSQGWIQLNVYVPEELRIKVKVKALQEDRDMSDVVTELLTAWTEQD